MRCASVGRGGEDEEELGVEHALVEAQAQGGVVGVGRLRAVGAVDGGLGHAGTVASRRATRARSSGTSSASNQGLRLSQAVLRQEGCGSGSASGPAARQSRTVSETGRAGAARGASGGRSRR